MLAVDRLDRSRLTARDRRGGVTGIGTLALRSRFIPSGILDRFACAACPLRSVRSARRDRGITASVDLKSSTRYVGLMRLNGLGRGAKVRSNVGLGRFIGGERGRARRSSVRQG